MCVTGTRVTLKGPPAQNPSQTRSCDSKKPFASPILFTDHHLLDALEDLHVVLRYQRDGLARAPRPCCSQNGYLSSRGGCQNRWHLLVNGKHGASIRWPFDSPVRPTRCT
jgi:hypothetical protein